MDHRGLMDNLPGQQKNNRQAGTAFEIGDESYRRRDRLPRHIRLIDEWRIHPPGAPKVVATSSISVTSSAAEKRKRVQPVIDADLVVLDDLFLARQLPSESADTLQSILHKRYKLRRSSLITSNRIIDDWLKFLGDAALATAILDRLLHRSVLVEFRGKSYRLKEAANRLATGTHSE